jgi:prefoldin subunit 5
MENLDNNQLLLQAIAILEQKLENLSSTIINTNNKLDELSKQVNLLNKQLISLQSDKTIPQDSLRARLEIIID